ncbi:MAG: serine hydrolase [Spirochaetes bacterium]|nr:serine hydrolase [Spirochaetota bacterium]
MKRKLLVFKFIFFLFFLIFQFFCFYFQTIINNFYLFGDSINISIENCKLASKYSLENDGVSFLVFYNNSILYEEYLSGRGPETPNELASGTKSFSGILACLLIMDGLMASFDEKISDTINEWENDTRKKNISVYELLTLTSGIDPGEKGNVPTYLEAINYPIIKEKGEDFLYGPVPFQVFGEFVKRKLKGKDPLIYLKEKLFDKINLKYSFWRYDKDGNPQLPSGAYLTARNWAKFGKFIIDILKGNENINGEVIIKREILEKCFKGTKVNPLYGITFWLNGELTSENFDILKKNENGLEYFYNIKEIPKDLIMVAGAGKQRLYIIPSLNIVIVRQASKIKESLEGKYRSKFSDITFLKILLTGKK